MVTKSREAHDKLIDPERDIKDKLGAVYDWMMGTERGRTDPELAKIRYAAKSIGERLDKLQFQRESLVREAKPKEYMLTPLEERVSLMGAPKSEVEQDRRANKMMREALRKGKASEGHVPVSHEDEGLKENAAIVEELRGRIEKAL